MPPFTNPIIQVENAGQFHEKLAVFTFNWELLYCYSFLHRYFWYHLRYAMEYDCRKELAEVSKLLCTKRTFNLN